MRSNLLAPKFLLRGILFLSLIGTVFIALNSCNREEDRAKYVTHTITYKAETSAGSNLKSVTAFALDAKSFRDEPLSGTTWSSDVEGKGLQGEEHVIALRVDGTGIDVNSTLKIQIYVDGDLKKEEISKGLNLEAYAEYKFKD